MTSRNAYVLEVSLNMLNAFVLHLSLFQMSFEWSYYKILQMERTVGLRMISYTVSLIAFVLVLTNNSRTEPVYRRAYLWN